MNSKELLNWGELSRQLSGSRGNIRRDNIPKKYAPIIKELLSVMDDVLAKLPDKAEKAKAKEILSESDEVDLPHK